MDTGLHYFGFTRDKALEYFSKYAWDDTDLAKKEVIKQLQSITIATVVKGLIHMCIYLMCK